VKKFEKEDNMAFFSYVSQNLGYMGIKALEHLYLFAISWALAIVVGMLIGIYVTRPGRERGGRVALIITGMAQAVPSIAVIALVFIFMGIGAAPAIFALFLYSIVPITFNTASGLFGIDKGMIEAAKGMGMTNRMILWKVEIPNAIPTIFSGIRNAAIINLGTATIASAIGAGGLGELIFIGLGTFKYEMILAGAIPVSIMAILIDLILGVVQNKMTSEGLKLQSE
jgi:osmoprotectant transport system permease protein